MPFKAVNLVIISSFEKFLNSSKFILFSTTLSANILIYSTLRLDNPTSRRSLVPVENIISGVTLPKMVQIRCQMVSRALSLICCPTIYLTRHLKPSFSIANSLVPMYLINLSNVLSVRIRYCTFSSFKSYFK